MAAKQTMIQAITQATIEAAKTVIEAVKGANNSVNAVRSVQVMPRTHSPALKQPAVGWKTTDKCQGL